MITDFEQPDKESNQNNNDESSNTMNDIIMQSSLRTTRTAVLTRLHLTRIPVAKPIRWDQQDPSAPNHHHLKLSNILSCACVTGSTVLTIMAWSVTAALMFGYFYTVWNAILFPFGERAFHIINMTLPSVP